MHLAADAVSRMGLGRASTEVRPQRLGLELNFLNHLKRA